MSGSSKADTPISTNISQEEQTLNTKESPATVSENVASNDTQNSANSSDFSIQDILGTQPSASPLEENAKDGDVAYENISNEVKEEIAEDEKSIIEEEEKETHRTYKPPPIPEPSRSFAARFWDILPTFIHDFATRNGIQPPIDAQANQNFVGIGDKGVVLLGPTSAGKTTLIASIARACRVPVYSDIDLRWRPGGNIQTQTDLSELLDTALTQILEKRASGVKATDKHVRYDFYVEGRHRQEHTFNSSKIFDMKMSFHDGPGGAIFTKDREVWQEQESTRNSMLRDAKNAFTLIFCLDASQRQGREFQSSLMRLLPLLQKRTSQGLFITPMRVVILLNKVDQLSQTMYTNIVNQNQYSNLHNDRTFSPHTLTQQVDPYAMALECLGFESIKMLRDAMRPDAKLAIGMVSTWGFKPDGHPLVNQQGQPNFQSLLERGSENEFMSLWKPYGIRELLIYLATGRVASMLHVITPDDLNRDIEY